MFDSFIAILIVIGVVEPPSPREVCILNQVWLMRSSSIEPTNKECHDEPCIAWPKKSRIIESDR